MKKLDNVASEYICDASRKQDLYYMAYQTITHNIYCSIGKNVCTDVFNIVWPFKVKLKTYKFTL